MQIAVVGAGVIGLSIAFELRRRGADVRVYDTREPAKGASWAAAGMLAPLTERLADASTQALCEQSLAMYPAFAGDVRAAGGVDPYLSLNGILHAAFDEPELERLRVRASELNAGGHSAKMLTRPETLLAEPALGKHVAGALLVEAEGHIDNRRLGRALIAACEVLGVQLHGGAREVALEFDARRVLGVRSDLGFHAADAVINAAGAWASSVAGVPDECVARVHCVKGQMLALAIPAGFMRRATWVPGAYLVPRADGRLLVGATVEDADDVRVTAGGIHTLLHAAVEAAPALREFAVTEMWAGLRPGTPDERPYIGATSREGYFLATGHYRNGILLAPVTARMLADAVLRAGTKAGAA
jgi:glycine oxidase